MQSSNKELKLESKDSGSLSLKDRRQNPQFGGLFYAATRKQLVRQLQANHRKKHGGIYKGDETETLADSLSTSTDFIPRPSGPRAEAAIFLIAACVNEGRLQDLPFDEPDFHLYLNEALRLGKIKWQHQILAPLLLWSDRIEFRNRPKKYAKIRKHKIGERNEPYPITEMASVLPSDIPRFQKELAQIPASERCYYTINFSHRQEIALLWACIKAYQTRGKARYLPWLKKYIDRFNLSSKELKQWKFDTALSSDTSHLSEEEVISLRRFIVRNESPETVSFARLPDGVTAEPGDGLLRRPLNFPSSTDAITFYTLNNPLVLSFLQDIYQQAPEQFEEALTSLDLGTDKEQFKLHLCKGEAEEAAALLCRHWKEKAILSEKDRQQYEAFYEKKEFSYAAHILWRGLSSGKEMTLCALLHDENSDHLCPENRPKLKEGLQDYLAEFKNPEQSQLNQWVALLDSPVRQKAREAARSLQKFIMTRMSPLTAHFWPWSLRCHRDHASIATIINSHLGGPKAPWVTLSPDYNRKEKDSPLLCSVTYTQAAYNALQHTLYGKDAIDAELSYGGLGLVDYRDLGENPGAFGRLKRAKPVESYYPTLAASSVVHGVEPHIGQLIRHDLLSHNLMNSSEPFQDFLNYFKRLLSFEKGFAWSKSIYHLVDLAVSTSGICRAAIKQASKHGRESAVRAWLLNMLPLAGRGEGETGERRPDFWKNIETRDENLLLVVDLLLHEKEWIKLFHEDVFQHLKDRLATGEQDVKNFVDTCNSMKKLAAEAGDKQQRMYYVLAYRLRRLPERAEFCKELQKLNLKHILQWERNAGLRFYKDFGFGDNARVEEMKDGDLYDRLGAVVQVVEPLCASLPHFSPAQAAIYCILAYRLRSHPQAQLWQQLLKNIDLSKILRFRSSDRKLYFVDPKTNDRELNLLTKEALPVDDKELALRLAKAFQETYARTPRLLEEAQLTEADCELLGLPKSAAQKASPLDAASLLRLVQTNSAVQLKAGLERRSPDKGRLPPVLIETALQSAETETILVLTQSGQGGVSLAALEILAERQQTNKKLGARQLAEILYQLLSHCKKPDQREVLKLENLFHPEFLMSQEEFLLFLLEKGPCLTEFSERASALSWWTGELVRNRMRHGSAADILKLLRHPAFPRERGALEAEVLRALLERQKADIPLTSKLSVEELKEIFALVAPKLRVLSQTKFQNSAYHPAPATGSSIKFTRRHALMVTGLVLGVIGVILAATGILAPVGVALGLQGVALTSPIAAATVGVLGLLIPATLYTLGQWVFGKLKTLANCLQCCLPRSRSAVVDSPASKGGSTGLVFEATPLILSSAPASSTVEGSQPLQPVKPPKTPRFDLTSSRPKSQALTADGFKSKHAALLRMGRL